MSEKFQDEIYIVHGEDTDFWLSVELMQDRVEFVLQTFETHPGANEKFIPNKYEALAICDAFAKLKERIESDG